MEKEKAKYVPWSDKERELLRHLVNVAISQGKNKTEAFTFASKKLGRGIQACIGAYAYVPKTASKIEEELIEQVIEEQVPLPQLKINLYNDIALEKAIIINVNELITVLKIGDVIVTLELCV